MVDLKARAAACRVIKHEKSRPLMDQLHIAEAVFPQLRRGQPTLN